MVKLARGNNILLFYIYLANVFKKEQYISNGHVFIVYTFSIVSTKIEIDDVITYKRERENGLQVSIDVWPNASEHTHTKRVGEYEMNSLFVNLGVFDYRKRHREREGYNYNMNIF